MIAVVTLLSWWITRKTTKRIQGAVAAADALARGNLDIELTEGAAARDEAGLLAQSFNELVSTYRAITDVCRGIATGDFSRRLDVVVWPSARCA